MSRLVINNKCYPPEIKIYEEGVLKKTVPIEDFEETYTGIIKDISDNVFDEIKLLKIAKLFEAESIEIIEKD